MHKILSPWATFTSFFCYFVWEYQQEKTQLAKNVDNSVSLMAFISVGCFRELYSAPCWRLHVHWPSKLQLSGFWVLWLWSSKFLAVWECHVTRHTEAQRCLVCIAVQLIPCPWIFAGWWKCCYQTGNSIHFHWWFTHHIPPLCKYHPGWHPVAAFGHTIEVIVMLGLMCCCAGNRFCRCNSKAVCRTVWTWSIKAWSWCSRGFETFDRCT